MAFDSVKELVFHPIGSGVTECDSVGLTSWLVRMQSWSRGSGLRPNSRALGHHGTGLHGGHTCTGGGLRVALPGGKVHVPQAQVWTPKHDSSASA